MAITAADVKRLRESTGAGIMECKKALGDADGNFDEAKKILRKMGAAVAAKKAGRSTAEGIIGNYIHTGSRLGVLVEVNCETDFVARNEDFQAVVRDIAMHIAAAKPRFLTREDVTEEVLAEEREIYAEQARASGKPDKVVEKIVDGRMNKFYEENCLLDQPFVRDTDKSVGDLVKETIAKFRENIQVGRFVILAVGEGDSSEGK
jgi:elongation factor Ts